MQKHLNFEMQSLSSFGKHKKRERSIKRYRDL
ncbi:unnamed protein product [Chironomus riparius]|uniref:Uncharacterized protein n=1 Tax=Chironomus riparius TaxID=315576 RepID=A0A9N9RN06_9DIPT|nr:unnamed protein product [Chironomus riparius]